MTSVLDWEATPNPVKENRAGIIGKAVDRYEGPLKVSGTAAYAYEVQPPSPPAYGVLVSAPIAKGFITKVDTAAAEAEAALAAGASPAEAIAKELEAASDNGRNGYKINLLSRLVPAAIDEARNGRPA